jgi:guanylate kinase
MAPPKQIVILSGPSCVGKGPLLKALRRLHPELPFADLALHTTRSPRFKKDRNDWEVHGEDYFFMPRGWFEDLDPNRFLVAPIRSEIQAIDLDLLQDRLAHQDRILAEIHPGLAGMLTDWIGRQSRWTIDIKKIFLLPMSGDEIKRLADSRGQNPQQVIEELMWQKLNRRAEDPPGKIDERARAAYDEILQSKYYPFRIVNPSGEDDLAAWSDPLGPEPRRVLDEFIKIIIS